MVKAISVGVSTNSTLHTFLAPHITASASSRTNARSSDSVNSGIVMVRPASFPGSDRIVRTSLGSGRLPSGTVSTGAEWVEDDPALETAADSSIPRRQCTCVPFAYQHIQVASPNVGVCASAPVAARANSRLVIKWFTRMPRIHCNTIVDCSRDRSFIVATSKRYRRVFGTHAGGNSQSFVTLCVELPTRPHPPRSLWGSGSREAEASRRSASIVSVLVTPPSSALTPPFW